MSNLTIGFSFAYILLGIAGFVLTGSTHKTALIPAGFGLVLLILGFAAKKENLRMHVMHTAVLIALLAFAGTARSLTRLPSVLDHTAERPAAIVTQSINAALSLAYIAFAVRSFIQARRARSS
ncbi:MAG: hypothetical protein EB090_02840 [Verrucomicrobia bacterium]|nr:hypothetical protein [Verrucomicrobiota bacterium]